MKRYCIKSEEMHLVPTDISVIRKSPFTLLEAYKHYIPSRVSEDIKRMEEERPPLPDCVRESMIENIVEISGSSKEVYEKNIFDNLVKDNNPIFPECETEMVELFKQIESECEITNEEEEMYGDILRSSALSELIRLDVYLHTYYTILYEKNEDKYVPLVERSWPKDKKTDMRNRRKECRRPPRDKKGAIRNHEEGARPFEIVEKENKLKNNKDKSYYEETMIQDFAPNVCRLYYWSPKFRKIFISVKRLNTEKYQFSEIKGIFSDKDICLERKEEVWLCEKLLGINLTLAFYSFFHVILEGIDYNTIEKDYREVIQGIVREVMRFKGIYTRCVIIEKLKMIYEIRKKSHIYTPYDCLEKLLNYLHEQVLIQCMQNYANQYACFEYCVYLKNKEVVSNQCLTIEKLERECDTLLAKYFEFSEGYYLMKSLPKEIKNEKIYALIQNIVINER